MGFKTMIYPNKMSGNEFGAFNGNAGKFVAPISGRYSFRLFLVVNGGSGGYYSVIHLRRNSAWVHALEISGTRSSAWEYDCRHMEAEIDLNKGEL